MHQIQRSISVLLILIFGFSSIAFSGCMSHSDTTTASVGVPIWGLIWSPQKGVPQNVQVQTAFASNARLLHSADVLPLSSDSVTWLVIGHNWGVALIRLDPMDTYQDLVIMGVNTQQHIWTATITSVRPGQQCPEGLRVIGTLIFPGPVCSVGTLYQGIQSGYTWHFSLTSWYAGHDIYIFAHFAAQAQKMRGAVQGVQINGISGWVYQEHQIVSIVLPLDTQETLLTVCTTQSIRCQAIAQQQLTSRDELVPLQP